MTVLKNKMLVRFEFSTDGQQVISYTEFFNNEWGRLRDICVSPDGKIYLATNGYSWPSQGPNEIIEIYNPDFDNTLVSENKLSKKILYNLDFLGRSVDDLSTGLIFKVYDDGSIDKKYIICK